MREYLYRGEKMISDATFFDRQYSSGSYIHFIRSVVRSVHAIATHDVCFDVKVVHIWIGLTTSGQQLPQYNSK